MSSDGVQWGWKSVNPAEPETAPVEAAAVDEEPRESSGTFIGAGALFEGTLSLQGDFRIDSEFRGELCTDAKIVVGPKGSVVGDLKAREIEVFGAVVGNVSARRQMILHAGARLHGDIETACLEVERHAFFQGGTKMNEPQAIRRTSATTESEAPAAGTSAQSTASAPA
jgi:cytoskeletal protein CcmA (bactofilin family)